MSEHAPRHEQAITPGVEETLPMVEHAEKHYPAVEHQAEAVPSAEISSHHAKQEAKTRDEIATSQTERTTSHQVATGSINPELAMMTKNRLLKHIRAHLPASDRTLSRFIHTPAVDQLSELGGKTIARPSGLLSGGICAFLGSLLFLYISKQYGYSYNFLLFGLFFSGGLIFGLLLEGLLTILRRLRSS